MPARPTVHEASLVSGVTTSDSRNTGNSTPTLWLTISIVVPFGAAKFVWVDRWFAGAT